MDKTCYIDVKPEAIKEFSKDVLQKHADSVLVSPIVESITTFGPTSKNKGHRLLIEVVIPEGGIKGQGALDDFGVMPIVRVPKARIADKFLPTNEVIQ